MVKVFIARFDSLNLEGPSGSFLSPKVIPPLGPKLGVESIWGEEIECFSPRLCNIVGTPGDPGGSRFKEIPFAAPVLRLSRLGFRLPVSVGGLMKDGDDGSEVCNVSMLGLRLRARLLRFFVFLGEGEVIGR